MIRMAYASTAFHISTSIFRHRLTYIFSKLSSARPEGLACSLTHCQGASAAGSTQKDTLRHTAALTPRLPIPALPHRHHILPNICGPPRTLPRPIRDSLSPEPPSPLPAQPCSPRGFQVSAWASPLPGSPHPLSPPHREAKSPPPVPPERGPSAGLSLLLCLAPAPLPLTGSSFRKRLLPVCPHLPAEPALRNEGLKKLRTAPYHTASEQRTKNKSET